MVGHSGHPRTSAQSGIASDWDVAGRAASSVAARVARVVPNKKERRDRVEQQAPQHEERRRPLFFSPATGHPAPASGSDQEHAVDPDPSLPTTG